MLHSTDGLSYGLSLHSLAVCLGTFEDIPDKSQPGGYNASNTITLKVCQQYCVDLFPDCAAVDFEKGRCTVHYNDMKAQNQLIKHVGNIHYRMVPCSAPMAKTLP